MRAALGTTTDGALAVEVLQAGKHLLLGLVEAGLVSAAASGEAAAGAALAADVEAVATDMVDIALRCRQGKVDHAWAIAVHDVIRTLPHAARLALLSCAERWAEGSAMVGAAAHVGRFYGDAMTASAYAEPRALLEDMARMRRFAGSSEPLTKAYVRNLVESAGLLKALHARDPRACEVGRALVVEFTAFVAQGVEPALGETLDALRAAFSEGDWEGSREATISAREQDAVGRALEAALVEAGFPTPPRERVSEDDLALRAPWFPFARRGWLVCFDAETGFAPHQEHGETLRVIARTLGRPVEIEEDGFVEGSGWRLVFRTPERHELLSPAEEPDDWIDLDLLYRAAQLVAGDVPLWSLDTGDQTVALLCAPAAASVALERGGWLKHAAVRARRVGARRKQGA
ncbi:hypothetical protein [Chondromyces crocatus]|nr:hypothetical protein [Chondromyces crocatus]